MLTLKKLTVDYRQRPLGVENRTPRFGWQAECDARNFRQAACRVRVATSPEGLNDPDCWDSGELLGSRSDNIVYAGVPLQGATPYWFRVEVRGEDGSTASADSCFETALYNENFTAKWIAQPHARAGWAPYLRREFTVRGPLVRARLYACGLGYGEAWLNGRRVTENVLEPMITNFEKLVEYAAYDITDALRPGANAVGMVLGCGFYNQDRVWCDGTLYYGAARMLAEVHLWYADGSREVVVSDESWQCDYSPITLNNVYGGETYDARLEQPDWCLPGFDAAGWRNAVLMDAPGGELVCRQMPPIRRTRRVQPVSIRHLHPGTQDQTWIVDMGQNFAGWAKINIPYSPAGAEYVLRFSECIQDGSLDFTTCGTFHTCLLQQDRYIAKGLPGGESFEPRFTYHGFQYIEITGVNKMSTELPENFLEVYAVNTALESAGSFHASFEPINRLQTLGLRTILSNYHGIPEDCPVREKCGWLGDAQLVSEAAIQNFDMAVSYEKYLEDIRTSKEVFGTWQMIAPGKRTCGDASPLWGCAQVIIPWNLYLYYNDTAVLRRYYPLMKEWVQHEKARSVDCIIDAGLGDWCPPGGHEGNAERIPVAFSSSAEFYHVTELMHRVAILLDEKEDAAAFAALAQEIRSAVNRHFLRLETPTYGTMGADGVALAYGICPENLRESIAADCVRIINERCGGGFHTGIYGNKYMVPALTEAGYGDDMLATLFNPVKLSFATMMADGAGSVWECFNGAGSSRNHPMQFAFASWFYTHILGLRPVEEDPGYHTFRVRPYTMARLNEANGSRETLYGTIHIGWKMDYDTFTLRLCVPANTTALCELPLTDGRSVTLSGAAPGAPTPAGKLTVISDGVQLPVKAEIRGGRVCCTLGSGSYTLICR